MLEIGGAVAEYPAAALLALMIVANWVGAAVLVRAWRRSQGNHALRDAATKAVFLALALSISFPLWLNVRFDFVLFPQDAVVVGGWIVMVGVSLPVVWFLWLYFRGGFGSQ